MQITSFKEDNKEYVFFIKNVTMGDEVHNIQLKVKIINKKVKSIIYAMVEDDCLVSSEEIEPSLRDQLIDLIENHI